MAMLRKYRLSDSTNAKDVDLRQYKDEIVDIINEAVPGKHPKVYKDHFTTDQLTHSEAVRIGRALSKSDNLAAFGKTVTTFRLFSGSILVGIKQDTLPIVVHPSGIIALTRRSIRNT